MARTTRTNRFSFTGGFALLLISASALPQFDVEPDSALRAINADSRLQLFPVAGSVFLLVDPNGGTNVTVQMGEEGVLLVDTGSAENADAALALIRRLTDEPIRYVINTTALSNYSGGNEVLVAAGSSYEGRSGLTRANGIAHENAMMAMVTDEDNPMPPTAFPDLSFYGRQQPIYFNGETVNVLHQPNANTNGESIVFFRKSDVISTGPVFLTTTYPEIYPERGGSIAGVLNALNRIIDITNTRKNQEGGTMVISGAGRVTDEAGVVEYRDMLTIIHNRIAYYMDQGMSLGQIQAARPTMEYDARFAAAAGPATPANFIDLIYEELRATREDAR